MLCVVLTTAISLVLVLNMFIATGLGAVRLSLTIFRCRAEKKARYESFTRFCRREELLERTL